MKSNIAKVKGSEVCVGQQVIESPHMVVRIEITERGKRKLKFQKGKSRIVSDDEEIEVILSDYDPTKSISLKEN